MNNKTLDKNIIKKYQSIYVNRVLPKKTVLKNTPESRDMSIKILEEFSDLRKAANEAIFLGKPDGRGDH